MKKGSMLISILIIAAIILTTVASFTTQAVFLGRSSLDQEQSNQAYFVAESLLFDTVQQYMRFGSSMANPYTDWTVNCLQEDDWLCKMELDLSQAGGTIDAWGQYGGKIKHLQSLISVTSNNKIIVNSIEEIFE